MVRCSLYSLSDLVHAEIRPIEVVSLKKNLKGTENWFTCHGSETWNSWHLSRMLYTLSNDSDYYRHFKVEKTFPTNPIQFKYVPFVFLI